MEREKKGKRKARVRQEPDRKMRERPARTGGGADRTEGNELAAVLKLDLWPDDSL
jgi:hypothetical protein